MWVTERHVDVIRDTDRYTKTMDDLWGMEYHKGSKDYTRGGTCDERERRERKWLNVWISRE